MSQGPVTFRTRKALPDVPEDVDPHIAHLNDPNYPFDHQDWSETDSFELDDKKHSLDGSTVLDNKSYALGYDPETGSEYSRSSSRVATSRAVFQAQDTYDDESPYPEVRAAVASTDDPSMPTNTFRMWFLGIIFTILISGINQFFNGRYPAVYVTGLVAQLISLPLGKALEYILPTTRFRIPLPFTNGKGWVFTLNPGPFNIKEHVLITVMANVTAGGAYSTDVIAAQRIFYGQHPSAGYQIFFTISSQLIGFCLAGVARRYLVWPSSMIWPGALVNCALFNTLHKNYGRKESKHISRERFFVYAMLGSFAWFWMPGYLFSALSVFNWVCWIAPQNLTVNALFGTQSGLGMSLITLDWTMITYIGGSPLVTPWWAQINVFSATVLFMWIVAPIMYFKNALFTQYFPISAFIPFDNTGQQYSAAAVVVNGTFEHKLYDQYSPIFFSATFIIQYGLQFALLTSTLVHVFLWYRKDIIRQFRRSFSDERDIHSRLMSSYPEVPQWWYALLGGFAFIIGIIVVEVYDTKLPVWAYIISLLLATVYMVPAGMIQAITNQQLSLNVLAEIIGGIIVPNRPVANMIFKSYGYVMMAQALAFTGDLKIGHYMKVPPRMMFSAQVIATLVSCFVVIGVQAWQFAFIPGFCTQGNTNGFTCPNITIFNTAAIIWGGIGADKVFGHGALYWPFTWFFLIGALAPIPFYFAAKRWPSSWFKFVNFPVFFCGPSGIPPASGTNYSSWLAVGFLFQYWMRRRHIRWWMRYNYILSAALDSGAAIGIIIVFFVVQLPKGGFTLNWWGNTVWQKTADAMGLPFLALAPNSTIPYTP